MEFERAEFSTWRNGMNKGPEGGRRQHVGELSIAEGGLRGEGVINEAGELGRDHVTQGL